MTLMKRLAAVVGLVALAGAGLLATTTTVLAWTIPALTPVCTSSATTYTFAVSGPTESDYNVTVDQSASSSFASSVTVSSFTSDTQPYDFVVSQSNGEYVKAEWTTDDSQGFGTTAIGNAGCSAAPTLSTQLSTSSAVSPATVTDTATLSGANAGATGAITISAYLGSNVDACVAGNLVGSSETASPTTDGNGSYTATFSGLAAGSYEFQASYAGDASNLPAESVCGTEPLTVSRAASSISTLLSESTTTVGGSVIDTATLSGATSGATGAITISAYSGSNVDACVARNLVGSSETASPTTDGNGSYTASFSGLAVGSFEFQASYAGDGNNSPATSGCGSEPLSVSKTAPSISTLLSETTTTVGGSVIDTATLSGATSGATGAITISAYSGSNVDACVARNLVGSSETASPTTDGNGSYTASFSGLAVGSYEFQASYAGDGNNSPATSGCGSEPLSVSKTAPSISTLLSESTITVGGSVTDTATLSDATGSASGNITISVFSGNSASACSGTAIASEIASPTTDGNGSYTASFSSLAAGSYEFQASYAGDGNNLPAKSVCGTEPLTVNQAAPSITTSLSQSTITVGGSVTDTATLSGASTGATGTITINVFLGNSASACSGTAIASETVSPTTDGNGSYTATFGPVAAGSHQFYEFQASYAGDGNNLPAESICGTEPLSVPTGGALGASTSTSTPTGGALGASATAPTTGADLVGPGLAGALALLLGGLLVMVGTRVMRLRSR